MISNSMTNIFTSGIAMGKYFASNHANLFLNNGKKTYFPQKKATSYFRYLDDICHMYLGLYQILLRHKHPHKTSENLP